MKIFCDRRYQGFDELTATKSKVSTVDRLTALNASWTRTLSGRKCFNALFNYLII